LAKAKDVIRGRMRLGSAFAKVAAVAGSPAVARYEIDQAICRRQVGLVLRAGGRQEHITAAAYERYLQLTERGSIEPAGMPWRASAELPSILLYLIDGGPAAWFVSAGEISAVCRDLGPAEKVPQASATPELTAEAVGASPASPKDPKKQSRRKAIYRGAQSTRAKVILKRMFPAGEYPDRSELPNPDLWHRFCKEYGSVEAKAQSSRLGMPSLSVVLRLVGRKER
jgi:hypothetical protein